MLKVEELSAMRHLITHLTTKPTCEMTRKMDCQVVLKCFPHFFTHEILRRFSKRKP